MYTPVGVVASGGAEWCTSDCFVTKLSTFELRLVAVPHLFFFFFSFFLFLKLLCGISKN